MGTGFCVATTLGSALRWWPRMQPRRHHRCWAPPQWMVRSAVPPLLACCYGVHGRAALERPCRLFTDTDSHIEVGHAGSWIAVPGCSCYPSRDPYATVLAMRFILYGIPVARLLRLIVSQS